MPISTLCPWDLVYLKVALNIYERISKKLVLIEIFIFRKHQKLTITFVQLTYPNDTNRSAYAVYANSVKLGIRHVWSEQRLGYAK